MNKEYHILNGDALRERFPKEIDGALIIARECFVDGNVNGDSLEALFKTRARFISEEYTGYSVQDYYSNTVSEFEKIQNLPDNTQINLWFEDDLFCQVNLWFTVNLIVNSIKTSGVFLVRPAIHSQYGFGGLNTSELISAYQQKTNLTELEKIGKLWNFYQKNDNVGLIRLAKDLEELYPFILNAVQAHIERIPTENSLGRPKQTLIEIMADLGTDSFGAIFKEFNNRASIYGFGDLQVKRIYDEIINDHKLG